MAQALIRMPDELHRALKLEAVKRGATMQELVQTAVRQLLGEPERVLRKAGRPAEEFGPLADSEKRRLSALVRLMRAKPSPSRDRLLRILDTALDIPGEPR